MIHTEKEEGTLYVLGLEIYKYIFAFNFVFKEGKCAVRVEVWVWNNNQLDSHSEMVLIT